MKLDENGKEQFGEIKEWLRRYKYAVDDLKSIQTRIEVLKDRILSPSSPILTDMPRSGSRDNDKIGTAYSIIDELEREAEEEAERTIAIYKEIHNAIRQIRGNGKAEIRLVLQLRHLDLMAWDEICFVIFGDKPDFYDRETTYSRKIFALHRQGVEALTEKLNLQEEIKEVGK